MFRLVPFADATPGDHDVANYISKILSKNIIDEMETILLFYPNEKGNLELDSEEFEDWYEEFFEDGFFNGIGSYLGISDDEAGREIVGRKIMRMREKLQDETKFITFDILEERIFAFFLESQLDRYERYKRGHSKEDVKEFKERYFKTKEQKKAKKVLMEEYDLSKKEAKKYSKQMYRIHKLFLEDYEADNLVFWDDDYDAFFERGFVEGLMLAKGSYGEMRGYGYQYVCDMFTDIGINPPLRLLGTEEANRIINERTKQQYMEQMNNFFDYIVHADSAPNPQSEEFLERFPFLKNIKEKLDEIDRLADEYDEEYDVDDEDEDDD